MCYKVYYIQSLTSGVGNKLTDLSSKILSLSSLTSLVLGYNQLTQLNANVGALTMLKTLDLRGNMITSLPSSIGELTNLCDLRLDKNELETLPDEISKCPIKLITLTYNKFKRVPLVLSTLTLVEKLDLSESLIEELDVCFTGSIFNL